MKILFAIDFSEPTSVTDTVKGLAERLGAELLVLHVISPAPTAPFAPVDPLTGLGGFDPYTLYDPVLEENLERAEEDAFQTFLAERFDNPVRLAMRKGDPAEVILADAEEQQVDLIVLGKRHHSRLEQLLLGSTTAEVVKHTTRPTLLMPIAKEES